MKLLTSVVHLCLFFVKLQMPIVSLEENCNILGLKEVQLLEKVSIVNFITGIISDSNISLQEFFSKFDPQKVFKRLIYLIEFAQIT